jgi:hypothetical protein
MQELKYKEIESFIKKVAFDWKHKLSDKWQDKMYHLVLDQQNAEIPIYVVQRDDSQCRKYTLHLDLLLPVGCTFVFLYDSQTTSRSIQTHPKFRKGKLDENLT